MRQKIRVRNIMKVKNMIEKDINKELKKRQIREGVAKIAVEDIRKYNNHRPRPATIKQREQLEKLNKTHRDYSRNKINFTFTGLQLKDLIKNARNIIVNRKTFIVLKHSNRKHKNYKKVGNKRKGVNKKTLSYREIYRRLKAIKKDYAYLDSLGNKTEKKIVKFLKRSIIGIYTKRRK